MNPFARVEWPVIVSVLALTSCEAAPSIVVDGAGADDASYEAVADWPKLPDAVTFGRVNAVAIDSEGFVYVAHTADGGPRNERPIGAPTIFVFDPESGELLRRLGAGLFRMPHGLSIDRDDHLWITDSDANLVFELDRDGRVLRTLGQLE